MPPTPEALADAERIKALASGRTSAARPPEAAADAERIKALAGAAGGREAPSSDVIIPDPSTAPGGLKAPGPREPEREFSALGFQPPPQRGRQLMLGTQSVGRGLADIAGAPVDLTSIILNALFGGAEAATGADLPGIERPVGGAESIANLFTRAAEAVGVPLAEPETKGERLAFEAERGATGALAGSGALARAALAGRGRSIDALRPFRERPGAAVSQDIGAGAAGAGAAEATGAALPEDTGPIGRTTAALLASLAGGAAGAGGVGTTQMAGRRAASLANPERGTTANLAAEGLQQSAEAPFALAPEAERRTAAPAAAGQIRRRLAEDPEDMALVPSGSLTDNTGLQQLEDAALPPAARANIEREAATRAGQRLSEVAPERARAMGPEEREAFAREAVDTTAEDLRRPLREAETAARATAERAELARQAEAPPTEALRSRAGQRSEAAERLDRAVVEDTLRPMQQQRRQLFEAIPDNIEADATPLLEAARRVTDVPRGIEAPSLRPFDPDAFTDGRVTTGELKALRPALSRAISEARGREDFARADALAEIKRTAESMLNDLDVPEARQAARFEREQFAPRFSRGAGGDLRRDINRGDLARSDTPPTETPGRFGIERPGAAGSREKAADLRRILSGSASEAEGQQAARDFIVARMARDVIGEGGRVNPAAFRKWRDDLSNAGAFDSIPGLKEEIDQAVRAAVNKRESTDDLMQAAKRAAENLDRTRAEINQSTLAVMLDADPRHAVEGVFANRDPAKAMREVVQKLEASPDPERMLESWQTAVADHLADTLTTGKAATTGDAAFPRFASLDNFIRKHEKTFDALYEGDQRNALRRAHNLLQRFSRSRVGGGRTGDEPVELPAALPVLLRIQFGHLRGGGVEKSIKGVARVAGRAVGQREAQQLIARAMVDPELAAKLLERPTPALWRDRSVLRALGFGAATGAAGDGSAEPEQAEPELPAVVN